MQYILHGNCRDNALDVPIQSVITDPPYAAHVHARMASAAAAATPDLKGIRHRDAGFSALDEPLREHIVLAMSKAARWSVVYTDLQDAPLWHQSMSKHVRMAPVVPLDDEDPGPILGGRPWMPQLAGTRPPRWSEFIAIGHAPKGRMHWGGPGNFVALTHTAERWQNKHPTAKPLDQALDLVAWFSDPGAGVVYDPCAGRGTIGVACALLGREYVGCESEAALAAVRIEAARRGSLSERDQVRFARWAKSVGYDGAGPLAFRGATFRKGRPT